MMNIKHIYIGFVTILLLFVISCTPHIFELNVNKADLDEISCIIMSDLDGAEEYAANAFRLHEESRVAMHHSYSVETQFRADYTVKLLEGEGLRFSFRTIADSFEIQPKISFDYTADGCFMFENGNQIRGVDSIKAKIGEKSRIIIENYGKLVNIVVDCDTVFYGNTELPCSEYVIVETLGQTKSELSGIVFSDLNSDIDIYNKVEPIIIR